MESSKKGLIFVEIEVAGNRFNTLDIRVSVLFITDTTTKKIVFRVKKDATGPKSINSAEVPTIDTMRNADV